ncbi:Holliday junction resolvase RuvX [bacterium]|nr:Holliday junction resolvase RuvX [bacterium]
MTGQSPTGCILALDYGRRRIGIAVSDPFQWTAQPLETWTGGSPAALMHHVRRLIAEKNIVKVIVGLPLTLKGDFSESTRKTEAFIRLLEKSVSVPVVRWDERLTTVEAARVLRSMDIPSRDQKRKIDQMAAALLLQSYLSHLESKPSGLEEHH